MRALTLFFLFVSATSWASTNVSSGGVNTYPGSNGSAFVIGPFPAAVTAAPPNNLHAPVECLGGICESNWPGATSNGFGVTVLGYARTESTNAIPIANVITYGTNGTSPFLYNEGYSNVMSVTYTPIYPNDGLLVRVVANTYMSDFNGAMALFRDPGPSNLMAVAVAPVVAANGANAIGQTVIEKMVEATETTATTFTVNLGVGSGQLWFNGEGANWQGSILGHQVVSSISVTEFGLPDGGGGGSGGCPGCFGGGGPSAPPCVYPLTSNTNELSGCYSNASPDHFVVTVTSTFSDNPFVCFYTAGEPYEAYGTFNLCTNSLLYPVPGDSSFFEGIVGTMYCYGVYTSFEESCSGPIVPCSTYIGPISAILQVNTDGSAGIILFQGTEEWPDITDAPVSLVGNPAPVSEFVPVDGSCTNGGYVLFGYNSGTHGETDMSPLPNWVITAIPSGPMWTNTVSDSLNKVTSINGATGQVLLAVSGGTTTNSTTSTNTTIVLIPPASYRPYTHTFNSTNKIAIPILQGAWTNVGISVPFIASNTTQRAEFSGTLEFNPGYRMEAPFAFFIDSNIVMTAVYDPFVNYGNGVQLAVYGSVTTNLTAGNHTIDVRFQNWDSAGGTNYFGASSATVASGGIGNFTNNVCYTLTVTDQ